MGTILIGAGGRGAVDGDSAVDEAVAEIRLEAVSSVAMHGASDRTIFP